MMNFSERLPLTEPDSNNFNDLSFQERSKILCKIRDEFRKNDKVLTSDILKQADQIWARGLTVGERAFWNDFLDNYKSLDVMEKSINVRIKEIDVQLKKRISAMERDGLEYEKDILGQELIVLQRESAHVSEKPRLHTKTPEITELPPNAQQVTQDIPSKQVEEGKGELSIEQLEKIMQRMSRLELADAFTDFSWDPPLAEQSLRLFSGKGYEIKNFFSTAEGRRDYFSKNPKSACSRMFNFLANSKERRFTYQPLSVEETAFARDYEMNLAAVETVAEEISVKNGYRFESNKIIDTGWLRCKFGKPNAERKNPLTRKLYFELDYKALGKSAVFAEGIKKFLEELDTEPKFSGEVKIASGHYDFLSRIDNIIVHFHPVHDEQLTDDVILEKEKIVKKIADKCFGKVIISSESGIDGSVVNNIELVNKYLKKMGVEMVSVGMEKKPDGSVVDKVSYKLLDKNLSPKILSCFPLEFSQKKLSYSQMLAQITVMMVSARNLAQ